MRTLLSSLGALLLAACEGAAPQAPADEIRAYFPAGGVVDTIEVDALERLPLRRAELVAPDGRTVPAASISARPAPTGYFSQQLPAGPYAGGGFGVPAIGTNPLSPAVVGAAPQTATRTLAILSSASISLPDPVAYRLDWRKYRIRLQFGAPPGEAQNREVPAPEPPPAQ